MPLQRQRSSPRHAIQPPSQKGECPSRRAVKVDNSNSSARLETGWCFRDIHEYLRLSFGWTSNSLPQPLVSFPLRFHALTSLRTRSVSPARGFADVSPHEPPTSTCDNPPSFHTSTSDGGSCSTCRWYISWQPAPQHIIYVGGFLPNAIDDGDRTAKFHTGE